MKHLIVFYFALLTSRILTSDEAFKSAKFVKKNVTSLTYSKSKLRAESQVGCGSWCLNTENCKGFKLTERNCTLYSDFTLYLEDFNVDGDDEAIEELNIVEVQCIFFEMDLVADYGENWTNISNAEACHQICLQKDECDFFIWVSPKYHIQQYHYNCWLKWGNLGSLYAKKDCFSNYRYC